MHSIPLERPHLDSRVRQVISSREGGAMDNPIKVYAVILTYNRKEMLHECLKAVTVQTRSCDKILIVDNASTDGTFEMLKERWGHNVEVYSLPKNVGAAGGFNFGMRMAYLGGGDFIWVMDDDVIPEAEALERLLRANEILQGHGRSAPFLVSMARSPVGVLTNVPTIDTRHNELAYENWPVLLENGLVPVRCATFVSILLPRSSLQKYGLPIASMFIWGEDTEYTLRMTTEDAGYLVGDSKVVHVRQLAGMIDIRKEQSAYRLAYFFHYFRNRLYIFKRYSGRRAAITYVLKLLPLIAALYTSRQFYKARVVLSGILIGWSFNPRVEAADGPFDETGIRSLRAAVSDAPQHGGAPT
jgi:GT2 family glycosyltransferase